MAMSGKAACGHAQRTRKRVAVQFVKAGEPVVAFPTRALPMFAFVYHSLATPESSFRALFPGETLASVVVWLCSFKVSEQSLLVHQS